MIRQGEAVRAASLDFVLEARDRRADAQRSLLACYGLPLVSMTLVMPGPVKDSPGRRLLMDMAEMALAEELALNGWNERWHQRMNSTTGPEVFSVVDAAPGQLKRLAISLEGNHSWGRLLDADVIVAGSAGEPLPLERQRLGFERRRCLLCEGSAKECLGARRHPVGAAAARVQALIQHFTGQA
jgi:holo-ACP synthase